MEWESQSIMYFRMQSVLQNAYSALTAAHRGTASILPLPSPSAFTFIMRKDGSDYSIMLYTAITLGQFRSFHHDVSSDFLGN